MALTSSTTATAVTVVALKMIFYGCILLTFSIIDVNRCTAMARSTTNDADKSVALLQQHLCRDECSKKVCRIYTYNKASIECYLYQSDRIVSKFYDMMSPTLWPILSDCVCVSLTRKKKKRHGIHKKSILQFSLDHFFSEFFSFGG